MSVSKKIQTKSSLQIDERLFLSKPRHFSKAFLIAARLHFKSIHKSASKAASIGSASFPHKIFHLRLPIWLCKSSFFFANLQARQEIWKQNSQLLSTQRFDCVSHQAQDTSACFPFSHFCDFCKRTQHLTQPISLTKHTLRDNSTKFLRLKLIKSTN